MRVVEFNARFGDPETQPLLALLESPLPRCSRARPTAPSPRSRRPRWKRGAAVAVVMASAGYPESSSKGDVITGIDDASADGVDVIHAGTALRGGRLVTAGGRVLAVTAVGTDVADARARAYDGVAAIRFDGAQPRTDIAAKVETPDRPERPGHPVRRRRPRRDLVARAQDRPRAAAVARRAARAARPRSRGR